MNFEQAFAATLLHEKGFQNNPADPGNWANGRLVGTKYGISARTYPHLDIARLTLDDAKRIYKRDFWGAIRADEFPASIRFELFDMAVHSGQARAIMTLQLALGVAADGRMGPVTRAAMNRMAKEEPHRLAARFLGRRLDFLNNNPQAWAEFGRGWAQRIADNLMAL